MGYDNTLLKLARVVFPSVKQTDHITPSLKKLHWLPIPQRITFKLGLLTFKALAHKEPTYLCQLLLPYNPTRQLRSSDQHLLTVPNIKSCLGRRSKQDFLSLHHQYGIHYLCLCILAALFLLSVNCLKLISFLLELLIPPAPTWILD